MADTDPQSPLVRSHDCRQGKCVAFGVHRRAVGGGAQPTASRPLAPPKVTGADQLCPLKVMT